MNNRNPHPSKAKSLTVPCLVWLVVTIMGGSAWCGQIRIDSGEETDTVISVNPNTPSANPGTITIDSGPDQDTVTEANPPAPSENENQPLVITPEIRVREDAPWPRPRFSGKP